MCPPPLSKHKNLYNKPQKEEQPMSKHIRKILEPPKPPRKIDRNKLFSNPNSKSNKKNKNKKKKKY